MMVDDGGCRQLTNFIQRSFRLHSLLLALFTLILDEAGKDAVSWTSNHQTNEKVVSLASPVCLASLKSGSFLSNW